MRPLDYDTLPRRADERTTLIAFLEWQRSVLDRKCAGLNDEQLRERSAPPSNLSLLGLVRHLTLVEQRWFRCAIAGEPYEEVDPLHPDVEFEDVDTVDPEAALITWRESCESSRDIAAARSLDVTGRDRRGREVSVRWVLMHMIEEYSRHNGHADLLRERIDGSVGY